MHRIPSIDALKAFLIFLVVLYHAPMHFAPYGGLPIDPHLLTGFFMQLFMMISGMFAASSLRLSPKDFIKKKFLSLMVPNLCWSAVIMCITLCLGNTSDLHAGSVVSLWFLNCLFICYALFYFSHRYIPNKWAAIIITLLVSQFIKENVCHMYPCFLLGAYMKTRLLTASTRTRLCVAVIGITAYIALCETVGLTIYDPNAPHTSDLFKGVQPALNLLHYRLFNLSQALVGSLGTMALFSFIKRNWSWTQIAGSATLGLYGMNCCILRFWECMPIDISQASPIVSACLLVPLKTLADFLLSVWVASKAKSYDTPLAILFGKRTPSHTQTQIDPNH